MWSELNNVATQMQQNKTSNFVSLSLCTFYFTQPGKQKKKFSSFFKSLVIELDKELYGPDNHLVEVRHPLKTFDASYSKAVLTQPFSAVV